MNTKGPHNQVQSLASIALGLMQQIAPATFDVGPLTHQALLLQLKSLDEVAAEREKEAIELARIKDAMEGARATPAFVVPDEEVEHADEHAAMALAALQQARSLDLAIGPGPVNDLPGAGPCAEGQAAAIVSIAHSLREACTMLRAIAAVLERAHTPLVTVEGGG